MTARIATGIADDEGGLATGAGSVWLLTHARGTLVRLDPDTHRAVAEISVAPGSFAAAFGLDSTPAASRPPAPNNGCGNPTALLAFPSHA